MFKTKVVEKNQNMHFIFSNFFLFFNKPAVCEIMWKNIVEPDRPKIKIRRMRIAFWTHKDKNTHSQYVTFIAFSTPTIVTRTRLTVTLYVHRLSCYNLLKPANKFTYNQI